MQELNMEEADKAKMDAAAAAAAVELEALVAGMTPEQRRGAVQLVAWLKKHYLAAGYRRLNRSLLGLASLKE
jgi:hypothetical protein